MIRRFLKQAVSSVLFYSHLLRLYLVLKRLGSDNQPPVLMYHRVLDVGGAEGFDFSHRGMVVSKETFEKQVAFLSRHYSVLSLDRFLEEDSFPPSACIITFDDGWIDNYTAAFPILKAHHCPATIFLSTDLVGTDRIFWQETLVQKLTLLLKNGLIKEFAHTHSCPADVVEKLLMIASYENISDRVQSGFDELIEMLMAKHDIQITTFMNHVRQFCDQRGIRPDARRRILDWPEIEEMHGAGISFGSHSKTHRIMTRLDMEDAKAEITESKAIIESHLGTPVKAFAYPNGDWNKALWSLVIAAGYKWALLTEKGERPKSDHCIALTRINIHEAMSTGVGGGFSRSLFACEAAGIFADIRRSLSKLSFKPK